MSPVMKVLRRREEEVRHAETEVHGWGRSLLAIAAGVLTLGFGLAVALRPDPRGFGTG
jgi:hypothetical protein